MPERNIFGKISETVSRFRKPSETEEAKMARLSQREITPKDRRDYIVNQYLAYNELGGPDLAIGRLQVLRSMDVEQLDEQIARWAKANSKPTTK